MSIEDHYPQIGLLFGILIIIICLILFFLKKRRRYPTILLVGCKNSGKTVLFSYLIYDRIVATYTSMKENIGLYTNKKRSIQLVDVPGHERLRQSLIDEHKSNARGVIFMIDSKTVQSEIRDVAELLYGLLIDPVIRSNCHNILIVCNKQDLPEAKGTVVVQLLLEKELNLLRGLKTKQLDSTSNEDGQKKGSYLGNRKKDFEFAHVKPINVAFVESVTMAEKVTETSLEDVIRWLQKF